jgi:hypothetical protein
MQFGKGHCKSADRCRLSTSVGRAGRTMGSTRSSAALPQPDARAATLIRADEFHARLFKRVSQCPKDGSAWFRGAALKLPKRDLADLRRSSEVSLGPIE